MTLAIVAVGAIAIGLVGLGLIYYSRPASPTPAKLPPESGSGDSQIPVEDLASASQPERARRSPRRLQIVLLAVSGVGILLVVLAALGRLGSGPPLDTAGWATWAIVALPLLGLAGALGYALVRRRETLGSMLSQAPARREEAALTCPYCSAALAPEEGLMQCGTCGSTLFRVPTPAPPPPDEIPVVLHGAKTLSVLAQNGRWRIETDGNTYSEPDEILDPGLRSVVSQVVELAAPGGGSRSLAPPWGLDDVQAMLDEQLARHPEFSAQRVALETDSRGFLRARVNRQTFIRLEEISDPALRGLLRETLEGFHANG